MKEKVQSFGRFLSGMVMPNIGAFIAWGLMAALFIDTGWLPNKLLNTIVGPFLSYALPLLIAYTGGKMVGGPRGAVMGAIATMGVIQSNPDTTMLMGAMVMGPLAGWIIKRFDNAVDGKIKPGFEMLVNNFSVGIIGMLLAIAGYYIFGPVMAGLLAVLQAGADVLVKHSLLPLVSIFVEPAKVLFLNNAINHGIFTPLGAEEVKAAGKSIFYMIETNPGPGTGVLLAYWLFSKDKATKDSAPGALIVHLLGGIHEISFPYILMNPMLLLATIGGSFAAMMYNTLFNLGLNGPASPGSIIAFVGMAPKGSTFAVLLSAVIAAAVSFAIAAPIIRLTGAKGSLDEAKDQMSDMKASAKGLAQEGAAVDLRTLDQIVFACDAGMGSSAMGAAVMQRKLEEAGFGNIQVTHSSVSEIPDGAKFIICHKDLAERAVKSAPQARLVTITNFMNAPEYDEVVAEIIQSRKNLPDDNQAAAAENPSNQTEATDNAQADYADYKGGVLIKKNIRLNRSPQTKEAIIRDIGKVFYDGGYTTEKYTEAMLEKEKVFNTAIGNNLAIPHGIEGMTGEILNSGLVIFSYPDGVDWGDGQSVKLVIGIASVGDEHVDKLAKIAAACNTEEAVNKILAMDVDDVYDLFK
ncbi:PTS system, mannitol-specific IIC component [Pseudoramibacter alactolyticus ATCC 23263]|uniref:Mannitol-specific phosphotransferase enzyme IIA component n=1 Tax=Pseudoramibacter alactolyticus ATCC 23263 TaxID=887929 RepID=E6MGJ6_9FIRM|nr:PTS mannitol transporter subunit IICBA [Pseudoramibacter alactolyticus]EFV01736.1 PTS system, mannitol-specific IIC component [Pseudoramibacter alactolyticus ATCC 23263]